MTDVLEPVDDDDLVLHIPAELPQAPRPDKADRPPRVRPWLRRGLVVFVVLFACWYLYEHMVSRLIFDQRQQHLAAEASTPTPSLTSGAAAVVVQVPAAGINVVASEGVDLDHLRGGPVRDTDGALPGDAGVLLVYGHREAYGGPFGDLDEVAVGGSIYARSRTGPAVQYRVVEVLRRADLSSMQMPDDADQYAYVVLVTSERGWFEPSQLIVVGKALPVTEAAPRVPDPSDGPQRGLPFGIDALLANLAFVGAAMAWLFLRSRVGIGIRVAVVAPMLVLGFVRLMMTLDALLPLTR